MASSSLREDLSEPINDSDVDSPLTDPMGVTLLRDTPDPVHRRSLPAEMCTKDLTTWSMIRKAFSSGNSWWRLSLPVEMMEPLSVVQCLCEETEFAELLNSAVKESDLLRRIALVTAFAVSRYGISGFRCTKKPYSCFEGETFEYVNRSKQFWFFGEHVIHDNPFTTACLARGVGWEMSQTASFVLSIHLLPVRIVVTPSTPVRVRLLKRSPKKSCRINETYTWNKVQSFISRLFSKEKLMDHEGELKVECSNGCSSTTRFIRNSYTLSGEIYDKNGNICYTTGGSWNKDFSIRSSSGETEVIWSIGKYPPEYKKYYGFSEFALTLNEITADIANFLPPTDARLRKDKRYLEEGRHEESTKMKHDFEKKNRARREARKHIYTPKWFDMESREPGKPPKCTFNEKYWQRRKERFEGDDFEQLWQ